MSIGLPAWRESLRVLALIGVGLGATTLEACGSSEDGVAGSAGDASGTSAGTSADVTSSKTQVRTLVVQVAGMKKSKGGST